MKSTLHQILVLLNKRIGRNTLLPLVLLLVLTLSCKKKISAPASVQQFTIASRSNSASYTIKVALPEQYDPQHKKYQSMYVLDGEDNFNVVAYHCKKLSEKYATENVLVVSIGYGHDRAVDYTPSKGDHKGGGSPLFMEFLEKELIPKIQSDFGADTSRKSRVILGHSFGGLFGAYAFTKHNAVFGNYLLLSPSLWCDNELILRYEAENREDRQTRDQLVFLGIGEQENSGRMQAPFEAFYRRLNTQYPGIKLLKNSVPQLNHNGSKNPNIEKSLDFYFQNK